MAFSYNEMYQTYERYVPEQTQEDIQRRDDEHLALVEEREIRGLRLPEGVGEMYSCALCGKMMVHPDCENSGAAQYHPACAEQARETA